MTPVERLTAEQSAIVEANVALVAWAVNKWHPRAPEHAKDEHIANGMLGLIRAAQKYNPALGFTFATFATYATFWIRQAIQKGQATGEGIGFRQMTGFNGKSPLGAGSWTPPDSLDRPIRSQTGDMDGTTVAGTISGDANVEADVCDRVEAEETLARLIRLCRDPLDIAAVESITSGEPLRDVGARNGVTFEAVRVRRERLMSRFRHPTNRQHSGGDAA